MKTEFTLNNDKQNILLTINGSVTAQTNFPKLSKGDAKSITIDLAGLTYVNSGGIKSWLVWIQEVVNEFKGLSLNFMNLQPMIVRQSAQVRGFIPAGSNVLSFYVPYYCESCNGNTNILFKRNENWDSNLSKEEKLKQISESRCPTCKTLVEIDAIPEHYIDF